MGDTFDGERDHLSPPRRVTIQDFYISKFEVTQEEWKEVMDTTPWKRSPFIQNPGKNLPTHHVSWLEVNVWEWCWDWYDKEKEEKGSNNHPPGLEKRIHRIIRGACWWDDPKLCRVYIWGTRLQTHTRDFNAIGFRLARSANQ